MTIATIIWVLILTYPGIDGIQRTKIEHTTYQACWEDYKAFRKDPRLHTTECRKVRKAHITEDST